MPTASHSGAGGSRVLMEWMSWASVSSATVSFGIVDGARLADDRDLDLARVLELAFEAPRDVSRQPDGLFVRDAFALHHDPAFAARLKRERLRYALEGVGDPLELLQPFDVRLENVPTGARPGGRDRVGGLNDHRFERGPVDIHVMGRHGHHDR